VGFSFAQEHNTRFQLTTSAAGVAKADPGRTAFAYDDDGELLTWPVAIAQGASIDMWRNWDWGVRADTAQAAWDKRPLMDQEFDLPTCPADKVDVATPYYPRGTGTGMLQGNGDVNDPVSPGENTTYWGRLSFGINEDICGAEVSTSVTFGAVGKWFHDSSNVVRYAKGELSRDAGERLRGNMDWIYDPATVLLFVDAGPPDETTFFSSSSNIADRDATVNLITSAQASAPGDLAAVMNQWFGRIPTKRHPGGRLNVIFADFHGETVKPVRWEHNNAAQRDLPQEFSGTVRVTPYQPLGN
jgi:prepilin-type processing-associated H-X9-DG protein